MLLYKQGDVSPKRLEHMLAAISSLPAYVQKSAMVMVLAPGTAAAAAPADLAMSESLADML